MNGRFPAHDDENDIAQRSEYKREKRNKNMCVCTCACETEGERKREKDRITIMASFRVSVAYDKLKD